MPTSGPIFISLTLCEKMSPSEPACSLVSVTTGPATASSGYVPTFIQREWTKAMRRRATFSSSSCETCPPRL